MPVIPLHTLDDPRVVDYAGVRHPARLRDRGLFVVEGRIVVRRLLACDRIAIRSLLLTEASHRGLADVLQPLGDRAEIFVAPVAVLAGLTGFNLHRGCLALAERPPSADLGWLLQSITAAVVLERVVDADNVGAIYRSAAAFGAGAVLLGPGCCDPLYRKAVRTSSGAAFLLPTADLSPWPGAIERLRAAGYAIVALTPAAWAVPIAQATDMFRSAARVALLVGNEGSGLTPGALARADLHVRIPIADGLDSINVAAAAAIALHRVAEVREAGQERRS
jgi:tRNA G18 (ribose-2'-O)-methylase SpoU